jgi:hypothetical protein
LQKLIDYLPYGCNLLSHLATDSILHIILQILQVLEHLVICARHALLDAIWRKHAEPRVAAKQRVPVCVRPSPHDVQFKIAQGATASNEAKALLSGQVASVEGLLSLFGRGNTPVEVVGIRLAFRHLTENARIVPGYTVNFTFVNVNDSRKERIDAFKRIVNISPEK